MGLSMLALALLAVRMLVRGDATYGFLAWNLLLAWIPLLLAVLTVGVWRSGRRISATLPLLLWLLFFPNSPYVVTDFVHLHRIGGMPRWFDILLVGTFALSALAVGFMSLCLIQAMIGSTCGVAWSWAGALTAIALAGMGIYLGRVYQLNSWDVLQPGRLFAAFAARNLSAQTHGAITTFCLTCLLGGAYAVAERFAARHMRIVFQ